MHPHIPEEELHAYCDGQLSPSQRSEIATHLLACLICRAQLGEVETLRSRTHAILEMAVPRMARPIPARRPAFGIIRFGRRGSIAAAALGLAGTGLWLALHSGNAGSPQPVTADLITPPVFAHLGGDSAAPESHPAVRRGQALMVASRGIIAPRIVQPSFNPTVKNASAMDGAAEVDPVEAAGWEPVPWDTALAESHGSLARLDGMPVTAVRLHRSGDGGRPTVMVRQQLADGRQVWVVEGPEEDVGPVSGVLEASGLAMSMPLRAHPDYVGSGVAPVQSIRVVTIAAYLPSDSLDALTARLKRQ